MVVIIAGDTRGAHGCHVGMVVIKDLDPVIPGIGHIQIPIGPNSHITGVFELVVTAAILAANCLQVGTGGIKELDPMVIMIGNVNVSTTIEGYAPGT